MNMPSVDRVPMRSPWQRPSPRLVLASGSVTRRTLLEAASVMVQVRPVAVDEAAVKRSAQAAGLEPGAAALKLAEAKAQGVDEPDAIIIGADQILTCEGRWFDKPADPAEARQHIEALSGRVHLLHTAVVCRFGGDVVWRHVATPRLTMRALSPGFIDAYVAQEGEALLSSVGAYRLEAGGIHLFDAIEGEHAAILGLPMLELLGFLRRQGALIS